MTGFGPKGCQTIEVSCGISEKDLIMMFPYTYVNYRVMLVSLSDPVNPRYAMEPVEHLSAPEVWLKSFRSFLETMGPAPEDVEYAH